MVRKLSFIKTFRLKTYFNYVSSFLDSGLQKTGNTLNSKNLNTTKLNDLAGKINERYYTRYSQILLEFKTKVFITKLVSELHFSLG